MREDKLYLSSFNSNTGRVICLLTKPPSIQLEFGLTMQNKTPFLLCLIGGILLIIASAVGSIGIYGDILTYVQVALPDLAGVIEYALIILNFIAGLGGIAVIFGATMLTRGKVGSGKFIIGIALSMGLIGLIIGLIQIFMVSGVTGVLNFIAVMSQVPGWIGTVMAIFGRRMASSD